VPRHGSCPASPALGTRRDSVRAGADLRERTTQWPWQATFAVIADHYLPFEQPAIFASLVREWLDQFSLVL
jgi:hypothetical protein